MKLHKHAIREALSRWMGEKDIELLQFQLQLFKSLLVEEWITYHISKKFLAQWTQSLSVGCLHTGYILSALSQDDWGSDNWTNDPVWKFLSKGNIFISSYKGGRIHCYLAAMWTLKRNKKSKKLYPFWIGITLWRRVQIWCNLQIQTFSFRYWYQLPSKFQSLCLL